MWPNPRETADLVTFTAEILNGKLHFLCSACLSFLTDKVLKEFNEGLLTEISCGVSHGPILGPLLFLICVSDMLQVETSTLLLYTDDSLIMYQDKEIKQVEKSSMKNLKTSATPLLIINWVFILVRIRQNLFFFQENGEQRISVNKILSIKK